MEFFHRANPFRGPERSGPRIVSAPSPRLTPTDTNPWDDRDSRVAMHDQVLPNCFLVYPKPRDSYPWAFIVRARKRIHRRATENAESAKKRRDGRNRRQMPTDSNPWASYAFPATRNTVRSSGKIETLRGHGEPRKLKMARPRRRIFGVKGSKSRLRRGPGGVGKSLLE